MPTDSAHETLNSAITLVTAALEAQEGDQGSMRDTVLLDLVTEPEGEPRLILGLRNLAMILLIRLEKQTGTPPEQTLREIALRYHPR